MVDGGKAIPMLMMVVQVVVPVVVVVVVVDVGIAMNLEHQMRRWTKRAAARTRMTTERGICLDNPRRPLSIRNHSRSWRRIQTDRDRDLGRQVEHLDHPTAASERTRSTWTASTPAVG